MNTIPQRIPAGVLQAHAPRVQPLFFDDPDGPPRCLHPDLAVVRHTKSNGTLSFNVQCGECGETRGEVAHAKLPPEIKAQALPRMEWDHPRIKAFQEAARAQAKERSDEQRRVQLARFRATHARNTGSSNQEWQRMRRYVFARAGNRCEAYLPGCTARAAQVHHLRYNVDADNHHVGGEPAWDLRAVCDCCHHTIHST